jgi:hypothetical protein
MGTVMRKPEQLMWDSLKRGCPTDFKLYRIENLCAAGTPDIFGKCKTNPVPFWLELKAAIVPARRATPLLSKTHHCTDEQINWHMDYLLMGGKSFILIRDDRLTWHLIDGRFAIEINRMAIDTANHVQSAGGGLIQVLDYLRNYEN